MNTINGIKLKLQNFIEDHFYLLKANYGSGKKVYLISYYRSGNSLVRTYFSVLQGKPQLSVYKGDVVHSENEPLTNTLDHINLIKNHEFNPKYENIIYVIRDGRNAMISHLYLTFLWNGHSFSKLEDIYEGIRHLSDKGYFWGDHVRKALSEASKKNLLFIKYEDLTKNPSAALKEIIRFIGADLSEDIISECICYAKERNSYFENPYNGYLYQPEENSIYHLLKKHRTENYWKWIFDNKTKQHFHERGGTEFLLRFGYEESEDWWKL